MSMTSCSLMPLLIGSTSAACAEQEPEIVETQDEHTLMRCLEYLYTGPVEDPVRPGSCAFKLKTGLFKNEPDDGIMFTYTHENSYSMEYETNEDGGCSLNRIYFGSKSGDPKFTLGRHWKSKYTGSEFEPQKEWYLTAYNVELSDEVKASNKSYNFATAGNNFTVLLNGSGTCWIMAGAQEKEIDFDYNESAINPNNEEGGAIAYAPMEWEYKQLSDENRKELHRLWLQEGGKGAPLTLRQSTRSLTLEPVVEVPVPIEDNDEKASS